MNSIYRTLGQTPVSPTLPCGRNVRHDDIFSELQKEMDKRTSVSERNDFSWNRIASISAEILKDHSKDILVACYLSVALTYIHEAEGLEEGTCIISDILNRFWNDLFPPLKRINGRISALSWWFENIKSAVETGFYQNMSDESEQKIRENLTGIDSFFENKPEVTDKLPSFNSISGYIAKKHRPVKKQEHKTLTDVAIKAAEEGLHLSDEDLKDPKVIHKKLSPFFQEIRHAAKIIHEQKADNPLAYRWLRFSMWDHVTDTPVSTNGLTRVPPPAPQLLDHLVALEKRKDWSGLVTASERALHSAKNIFFLDLNYFTATALKNMGSRYENACQTVFNETRFFVTRLKNPDTLHFSDGTPFASDRTRLWINENRYKEKKVPHEIVPCLENDIDNYEALSLGEHQDNLEKILIFYQDKINRSCSEKDRLYYRLKIFNALVSSEKKIQAAAQAEAIVESITFHNIDRWDPVQALHFLKTLFHGLAYLPDMKSKIIHEDLMVRINKINAAETLSI